MLPSLPALLMVVLGAGIGPAPGEHDYDAAIAAAIADTARVYPVPVELVRAVMRQESSFRPYVVSHAGAIGLMQVMPFNAKALGLTVEDLRTPERNILAGVRLLAVLLKHYNGDVISALVAYNARPRRLFAPVPLNGETPDYVERVIGYYRYYLRLGGQDLPQPSPKPVPRPKLPITPSYRLGSLPSLPKRG